MRRKLFSLTKKDFKIDTFRAGGKGGQNQNKVESGVRVRHEPSGAVGEGRDSRHQAINKQRAFLRCVNSPTFKGWHKTHVAKLLGAEARARRVVEEATGGGKIRVEVRTEKGWVEIDDNSLEDDQR
jgi:protein subunit release factor A